MGDVKRSLHRASLTKCMSVLLYQLDQLDRTYVRLFG